MAFRSLRFYHFRNLIDATLHVDAAEVFLIGDNGQGKTNLLEAIYFVCYGSSFRTRRDEVMRRDGEQEMAVEGLVTDAEGHDHAVLIKQVGRARQIILDGKQVVDRKEIVTTTPCIVFCHDDIGFVTGAPDMQRWFLNQTQALVDPPFIDEIRLYNRVLRSRNAALRDCRTELLDVLDLQLAEAGIPVQERRAAMTSRFNRTLEEVFSRVFRTTERLSLTYRPSWSGDDPAAQLEHQRARDLELGTTTSGPHRDRFPLRLGDRPLTDVASTGQLRLVSLTLRVAQAELISRLTGRNPVLLLDDVLLELDPGRRSRFVEALPEYDQAFFTFLPDEQYARFRKQTTLTYRVREGRFAES